MLTINKRFLRTATQSMIVGFLLVLIGMIGFFRISEPIVSTHESLEQKVRKRTLELEETYARIENKKNILQKYFNLVETIIVTLNREGRITMLNRKGCEVLGYTEEEIIGKSWFETCLPQPRGWEVIYPMFQRIIAGEMKGYEYFENTVLTKSGEVRDIAWRNNYYYDENNRIAGTISSGEDITERKKAETELKKAKEDAEQANMARSVFLSNMSHELRTPLNIILGYTQLMQRTAVSEQQKKYLEIVDHSGKHLLASINDVLEISKIEANQVTIQKITFDLWQMLENIELMFQRKIQQKNLRFKLEIDPSTPHYILSDEHKLRQVMINILSNAVKFTEIGKIIVRVGRKGSTFCLELECEVGKQV